MPQKIKIAILTTVHLSFDTRMFTTEAKTLSETGYEVILIAQHDKAEIVNGVRIVPLPKPKNRLTRMSTLTWKVLWLGLKENAQVYHLHDPELLIVGLILKSTGKRVIYDMHENVPKQILDKEWLPGWSRYVISICINFLERIALSIIPVIFAESSYRKDYLWVSQFAIVLNMPRLELLNEVYSQKIVPDLLSVGYIGGICELRGSIISLEALSILKNRGLNCSFHCVGPASSSHQKELMACIKRLGLERVSFYGEMSAAVGYKIIAKSKVGLSILKPVANYLGSYSTKMFEYMALGIPAVVSDFPLWRDIIEKEKCGLCVNPLDPEAVADAIQWLLEHPREAEAMGRNGQNAVKNRYNWGNEAKKLLEFYTKLLK